MSWVKYVTLGFAIAAFFVALLALICATPLFFNRMGWQFPLAPPLLSAPSPDSDVLKELRQIRAYTGATCMAALIQASDKFDMTRADLLAEFDQLDSFKQFAR
jgi:hypothetical protein